MENDINLSNTRKKIGLIAVVIFLIVTMISGATYAYLRWNSNNLFSIRIVTDIGDMGLTFDGGNMTINSLAPAPCTNGTYASKITTTIRRFNTSSYPGYVTFYLKLTSLTYNQGTLTSNDLSHIHFLLSTASNSCLNAVTDYYNNSISGTLDSAQIGSVGVAQSQTTTLSTWTYTLPARSGTNLSTGAITNTYYLYVWLDEDYTFTNYGSNGSQDPMEGLNFTLTWTSDGSIEQGTAPSQYVYTGYVPCIDSYGTCYAPNDDNLLYSGWQYDPYLFDSYNEVVSSSGLHFFARYKVNKTQDPKWVYTIPAYTVSSCDNDQEFNSESACISYFQDNLYNDLCTGGDGTCQVPVATIMSQNGYFCRSRSPNWCLEQDHPATNSLFYTGGSSYNTQNDCNDDLIGIYGMYNTLDEATAAGYSCIPYNINNYEVLDENVGYVYNGNAYYLTHDYATDSNTVVNSFGVSNCSSHDSDNTICSSNGIEVEIHSWGEYYLRENGYELYWDGYYGISW